MNTASCKWAYITALTAWLLAGAGVAASEGPQIAPSSCGGIPVGQSGNAFCSFEGTGDGAVIAANSCNVQGACLLIGNGIRIGHDSCNGASACTDTGTLNGIATSAASTIGDRSCNGEEACESAGSQGLSVIGNDSCNEEIACLGAGDGTGASYIGNNACNGFADCLFTGSSDSGRSVIGNGSCNGEQACTFSGEFGGISSIGTNSCNGFAACFDVAQGPFLSPTDFESFSAIGNSSCNADFACEFSGVDGSSTIGNHSCVGAPDLTDPDFPIGICDSNNSVIGNNDNYTP